MTGPSVGGALVGARVLFAYPAAVLRVLSRDRIALFISFLLPVALIVVVGLAFGGPTRLDVGWVDLDRSPLSREIVDAIEADDGFHATRFDDLAALHSAIRRKEVVAGVVIPADADRVVAAGGTVALPVVTQTADAEGLAAQIALQATVAPTNATLTAARVVGDETGGSWAENLAAARDASGAVRPLVEIRDVGRAGAAPVNRYSLTASQNLVLFVFMTAMLSASFLVAARRHGVLHRSLSTRASPSQVLAGLCLAIFAVTFVQSLVIVAVGSAVFRIDWGDPLAAIALVVCADAAAAAAGVLLGAVGRNPDRTTAMAPIVAVALAVVGGCVIPLELFPGSLVAVAHVVPHFWAVRGWEALIFDDAGIGDIAVDLLVLVSVTIGLLGTAMALFRRQLGRAPS